MDVADDGERRKADERAPADLGHTQLGLRVDRVVGDGEEHGRQVDLGVGRPMDQGARAELLEDDVFDDQEGGIRIVEHVAQPPSPGADHAAHAVAVGVEEKGERLLRREALDHGLRIAVRHRTGPHRTARRLRPAAAEGAGGVTLPGRPPRGTRSCPGAARG
jgi:hypothetical protein